MTGIQIKRVYDKEEKSDGFRIFIDKLWPRGIKKENLHYDIWAKDVAPSVELRKWFHEDVDEHWEEFREKYIAELQNSDAVKDLINQIKEKQRITLLVASKNTNENHAIILKEYIGKHLK